MSLFLILITLIFFFGFAKIDKPAVDSLDQTSYINFGEPVGFYGNSMPFINDGGYYTSFVIYQLALSDGNGNLTLRNYAVFEVSVPVKDVSFDDFLSLEYYDLELNINSVYSPFIDTLNPFYNVNFLEPFIYLDYNGTYEFNRYQYNEDGTIQLNFGADFYLRMPLEINNVINPLNKISSYLAETRPHIFDDELFDFSFDDDKALESVFKPIRAIFHMLWALFWEYPNWILKHITLYFGYFGGIFIW